MQIDIAHQLSPSDASWPVTIQDVTVKCDSFLILESPLIRRIYLSRHRRPTALCHISHGTGRVGLVIWQLSECLTGQNRTKSGQGRAGRCRMMEGESVFLGFSPFDTLVDRTEFSAMPISQRTFACLTF